MSMDQGAGATFFSRGLRSFFKAFWMQTAAGEGPSASLDLALEEVPDKELRNGLQNAIRLARGLSVGPGPIDVNLVPSTLRLCLAAGFASKDVPRFLKLASRIIEHNAVFFENAQADGLNSALSSAERYAVAREHEPRFFYSALYWLVDSGIDIVDALAALKADVVSQDFAYSIRAFMEDGPGEVVRWGELYDASFVEGMLAVEKEQSLDKLLDACRGLGEVPG